MQTALFAKPVPCAASRHYRTCSASRVTCSYGWQQRRVRDSQRQSAAPHHGSSTRARSAFSSQQGPFGMDQAALRDLWKTIDSMVTGDWDPKAPNSRARQAQDMMRNAANSLIVPGDVLESSGAYRFVVDLPGIPKQDIKVSVEAGRPRQLTVSAERTAAVDEQWTIRRSERYAGTAKRSWPLPEDADASKIFAKAEHGVLIVTVCKFREAEVAATIPVD